MIATLKEPSMTIDWDRLNQEESLGSNGQQMREEELLDLEFNIG